MKPIIGVMPLWDDDKESLWMLPGYFEGIQRAGGIPIMLPLIVDMEVNKQYMTMCDGFLFTGGHDVSPQIYGSEIVVDNVVCNKKRDHMESNLLKLALENDKSILGICRGIQFINAYLGGTLYQDLPTEHPSEIEHHQKPPYNIPVHEDIIIKDSPLYNLLRKNRISVNSYHHQAIKNLAPVLKSMAESEDGLIEAVYMPSHKYVWAVQWHPEFSYTSDEASMKIFKSFIESIKI
ncbi:MAG: gamma-glutamyl-gamma-aminobutyrate hydrolase family protein [Floccifex porci]|uniref:gamma-glutamyl-gamma-aminobutyrate hydrolase family protein n=1 Tax=Floccifex porci TaxID=2606629 RepID=UPI003F08357C